MADLTLTLRDLIWFASLIGTLTLAYGRIRNELRHLDDTKTSRAEMHAFTEDLRSRLEDIRMSVTRVEEALRHRTAPPQSTDDPSIPSP